MIKCALAGLFVIVLVISAFSQEHIPRFEVTECPTGVTLPQGVTVQCGRLLVRETRGNPKSRTLTLPVVTVKAREQKTLPPLVMLHGGPGESGIRTFTPSVAVGPLSRSRDVIIYDQRGAGLASPKLCPEHRKVQLEVRKLKTPKEQERLRDEGRRACKSSLKVVGVDLASYNTSVSATDLIELREALGIAAWDIFGGSYGARLAQEAMRRDPNAIRSVVLQSPATRSPATQSEYGLAAENVMKRVFGDCNSQPNCRSAFPTLAKDFYEVYETLSKEPLAIPRDGKDVVFLDHKRFLGRIQNSLGRPARLARVPLLINALRRGDKMLAARYLIGDAGQSEDDATDQVLIQITNCYDSYGERFLKELKRANAKVAEPFRSTTLSSCKKWMNKFSPSSEQEPVSSSIPTLLYTGRYDGSTPIEHARLIASRLKTAYVFEFPDQGHGGHPLRVSIPYLLNFGRTRCAGQMPLASSR